MPAAAAPAIAPPRPRLRPTLVVADVAIALLTVAGYVFPKLTESVLYWPIVVVAGVVLVPWVAWEYGLILTRWRGRRPIPLLARSLAASLMPALGAAVVGFVALLVGAAFNIANPDGPAALFYVLTPAAIVFALSVLTAEDERLPARRRARGECPHCGYDLRTQFARVTPAPVRPPQSPLPARAAAKVICPECGLSPDDLYATSPTGS